MLGRKKYRSTGNCKDLLGIPSSAVAWSDTAQDGLLANLHPVIELLWHELGRISTLGADVDLLVADLVRQPWNDDTSLWSPSLISNLDL